jgi:hypothetical protein
LFLGKNIVKLTIIVAALGAAGAIFAFTGKAPKAGIASDAKPIDLVCTKCSNHFQMPYKDYQSAVKAAPIERTDDGKMKPRRDAKPIQIVCEKCGEKAALAANRCPKHELYYPKRNADGSSGHCPQCPSAH